MSTRLTEPEIRSDTAPERLPALMASGELPQSGIGPTVEPRARRVTSVSVVIPAKDEAESLGTVLDGVIRVLSTEPELDYEIVVIDDGSDDGTPGVARAHGARVVRHAESLGNGAAIKRGLREARCRWVLMMDGDGQHPPEVIPGLLRQAEHFDMVVASRDGQGGVWYRNLANRAYNSLASYVTSRWIPDLTSGFRVIRADVAKRLIYLLPNTFSYPTTITLAMLRCGYGVGFHPFQVRAREGKSHIRLLRDGSRFFLIIVKIATFFAPMRVFMPMSFAMAVFGCGWYVYTYLVAGRFTNMAALLLTQATVIFMLGLISEQVSALRFARIEEDPDR